MPESSFVRAGGELRLTNLGQLELLRGMAERGKPLRTRVRGFSMSPFILDGDVITITPLNGRAPEVGEVIAFTLPATGRLAVHRIIAREGTDWLLRGDNSPTPDGIIAREKMIGYVTAVQRRGKVMRLGLGAERRLVAWMVRYDLMPWLNGFYHLPGRMAAALLHSIQASKLCRSIARRFRPSVEIEEAGVEDMVLVNDLFHLDADMPLECKNPKVTSFIARRGMKTIGSVQLVRHREADYPWTGYWLFSMWVRSRYRGFGIGEMLTGRVVKQAIEEGTPELSLLVSLNNSSAISLYGKMGFERALSPELEARLEEEERQTGRRRVVMSRNLLPNR